MSERKNIENLFQDKFKNFEVEPEQIVWDNIEIILKEKKEKRRIIPFWWKFSGVAALLAIGVFLFTFDNNEDDVSIEKSVTKSVSKPVNDKTNTETETRIATSTESGESEINKLKNNEASSNNITSETGIATSETIKEDDLIITKRNLNNKQTKSKVNQASKSFTKSSGKIASNKTSKIKNENGILSDKNNALVTSEKLNKTTKNSFINDNEATSSQIAKENKLDTSEKFDKNIAIATDKNLTKDKLYITNNTGTTTKINKDIVAQELTIKIDSTKLAVVEPNALEKLLNEKEKKITKEEPKLNRWQLSPNVAPIYFSSTGNGSPLDANLESNDKNYYTNYSYGIGVNYAVNKKLKVRTGVNVLSVDYDTNGILYYQTTAENGKLSNLNPNVPGSLLIIESLSNVNTDFGKFQEKFEGSLNQKMGYLEVPLELSYKIIDKKIGIDIIGGMSTLFLNQNEIFLQSRDLSLKIGEANNLNSVHFSGNLGLGFKYGFLKKMEARIEPVFKYQMNTFSNDVGDFKPYVFGVYSGISYTF